MHPLSSGLSLVVDSLRRAFATVSVGDDPVHNAIKSLRDQPEAVKLLRLSLAQSLSEVQIVWFLTQTGLSQEGGFFAELIRRIEERALPPIPPENDILYVLAEVFKSSDRRWMESMGPGQWGRLLAFLFEDVDGDFTAVSNQYKKAMDILAQRISGLGLDPFIAARWREREELRDHFLELGNLRISESHFSEAQEFIDVLKSCERSLLYVRGRREAEGTSMGLTYRLFYIEEHIQRMKLLLNVSQKVHSDYRYAALGGLLNHILTAHFENRKFREFFGRNIEILAYQVTILTGHTGEHYITNNAKELRAMWWKAIKGGFIVAFLVVLKLLASKLHLPPLPQAIAYGSIYASGFVLIHVIGGVIATKQPSMTASTLAGALDHREEGKEVDLHRLVDVIIRTLRSQLAALFGNYLTAFPVAILIVFPFLVWEIPVVTPYKASTMIQELHPVESLSFMYAAIAGVCLFIAGLVSGLADNWFDFNQIGKRLDFIFTGPRGKKTINYFRENFGIWMGNIILGFMLGSMSSIGIILGLPLDIRHVTFASGSFGIGWIHLRDMMPWSTFALIATSVFTMGLINLAVSFSLSLTVAMKSRRLQFSQGRALMWLLLKRILRSPHELFVAKD